MKHIVVDLEMNNIARGFLVRKLCTQETIEIGAVMLDDNMQEISSFRTYVRPEYNTSIAPQIEELTGINFSMVENAPIFVDAFRMFMNWCLGAGDDITLYAWSETDYKHIFKELILKSYPVSDAERPLLSNPWNDFQEEFGHQLGFEKKVALKTALDMAGITFSGREHDALDDARSTALLMEAFRNRDLSNSVFSHIGEVMTPSSGGTCLGDMFDMSAFYVA